MNVPTLTGITAAWHALPLEVRDRIGIIVVDLVFQGFVHGDEYVAMGQPQDRPVLDWAIREAAADAENARLNELHRVVQAALPDLFGPDGENPAWSENAGPTPTPAALAAVAAEAAETAARPRRLRSLRARLGRRGLRIDQGYGGYVIRETGSGLSKTGILDLDGVEAWAAGRGAAGV